ncbi:MAG: Hsp20/alpha crystallin family protein [Anaerolineae bacterium]|nr:Hsp20/alpha crystallin family protein [Anaerolineae bacterium]
MLSNPFDFRSSFSGIERLRREMNRISDQMDRDPLFGNVAGYPAMNAWTNDDGAIITAELPGINLDTLEISVHSDTMTLSGERNPEELGEGEAYHRRERSYGQFRRAFQLPFQIAADRVEATYDKGVLQITLPRAEADKPRKIQVRAS